MVVVRHSGRRTPYATKPIWGTMIKFLFVNMLVTVTLGGCSHKVSIEDLESFETTTSTQDDVLRKVGRPNKKLHA